MSELALEHVEAQLAWSPSVVLGSDEFEAGLAIDEAPDQPSAGLPINAFRTSKSCHQSRAESGMLIAFSASTILGWLARLT